LGFGWEGLVTGTTPRLIEYIDFSSHSYGDDPPSLPEEKIETGKFNIYESHTQSVRAVS
jgi:hypothetical protein